MFIVDYTVDYYGNKLQTLLADSTEQIINFVADNSSHKDFKVHRINKYGEGKLIPYCMELRFGRLVLEKMPLASSEVNA